MRRLTKKELIERENERKVRRLGKNYKAYEIVFSETTTGLTREVNKMLESGWILQGGIACQGSHTFYQSMVKY